MPEPVASLADVVRLTLPADARHVSTARVVAASLAAGAGFDVDEIDDLRLAVAEAAGLVLDGVDQVDPPDTLEFEFSVGSGAIRIQLRRTGAPGVPGEPDELALRILAAVVDRFEVADDGLVLHMSSSTAG